MYGFSLNKFIQSEIWKGTKISIAKCSFLVHGIQTMCTLCVCVCVVWNWAKTFWICTLPKPNSSPHVSPLSPHIQTRNYEMITRVRCDEQSRPFNGVHGNSLSHKMKCSVCTYPVSNDQMHILSLSSFIVQWQLCDAVFALLKKNAAVLAVARACAVATARAMSFKCVARERPKLRPRFFSVECSTNNSTK